LTLNFVSLFYFPLFLSKLSNWVVTDTGVQFPVVGGGAVGREDWTKKEKEGPNFVFPRETYLWILGLSTICPSLH
jgi:hypothetical protein